MANYNTYCCTTETLDIEASRVSWRRATGRGAGVETTQFLSDCQGVDELDGRSSRGDNSGPLGHIAGVSGPRGSWRTSGDTGELEMWTLVGKIGILPQCYCWIHSDVTWGIIV